MEVEITCGLVKLRGDLLIPPKPIASVIFVHGSGSSRISPRNQIVARYLNETGFTLFLAQPIFLKN